MYGITDSDPFDVMETVRLVPRVLGCWELRVDDHTRLAPYALNARVRAVYSTIRHAAHLQGSARPFSIMYKDGTRIPLDDLLLTVLGRTGNEIYLAEEDTEVADAIGPLADTSIEFERLHPSVLDGVPLDLHREVADRLAQHFPHIRFELLDMWAAALSDRHTNRFYLTGPRYANRGVADPQPYFRLLPRAYAKKELEIDLAPGMKLSLDSEHYSVDAQDNLVLAPAVVDAVQQFAKPGETITVDMLDPLVQLLPKNAQLKAANLRGQQLVDFLTAEMTQSLGHVDRIVRLFAALAPGSGRENVGEQLARLQELAAAANAANAPRPLNMSARARLWRAVSAAVRVYVRRLTIMGVVVVRAAMWLYRNNIASVLFYTIAATVVSHVLQRNTSVIYLLWLYTFLAVLAVVVQMRANVNLVEQIVLFAYPQVYPVGQTPADVLAAVPEAAVRTAVASTSNDEAVDYDSIVQSMVIKPTWPRVAAVCIGSLDPVSYKEWSRQVRQRRSLAYDAARLAVTKQQQIGL